MNKQQLVELYNLPLDKLLEKSAQYMNDKVELCSLINAKNGKCSQDCKYCAQSTCHTVDITEYPLLPKADFVKQLTAIKNSGVLVCAIVTSGKSPEYDFVDILEYIKLINMAGLKSCASLGILEESHVRQLMRANLKRYHHNINTASSYYKEICTTHTWSERYNTCRLVKMYGMELCCGVILGMGESVEQRAEIALQLSDIAPDSIPINILNPIKGTPFENYHNKIDDEHVLRTLAVIKIANPDSVLRFCGGRKLLKPETIETALQTSVGALMTGDMLTTTGNTVTEDTELIKKLGKSTLIEFS